jgi:hypothetical protein
MTAHVREPAAIPASAAHLETAVHNMAGVDRRLCTVGQDVKKLVDHVLSGVWEAVR